MTLLFEFICYNLINMFILYVQKIRRDFLENFLDDFRDFINERLQQPLLNIENSTSYKQVVNKYSLYYNTLKNTMKERDFQLIDSLISQKERIGDFYIDISYRTGFVDGINMKDSIKTENKE